MSFHHVLKRLRGATESQSIRVTVDVSDVHELLRDYDRIDAIHRDVYARRERQAQASRIPAGLYGELEALRTLRDAIRVYRDSYMRDEIADEDSCASVDQHDAACSVQAALESAQALEWKGGEQ